MYGELELSVPIRYALSFDTKNTASTVSQSLHRGPELSSGKILGGFSEKNSVIKMSQSAVSQEYYSAEQVNLDERVFVNTEIRPYSKASSDKANFRDGEALGSEKVVLEPGTKEFALYAASLDKRGLGYRFVKRIFDIIFSIIVIAIGFIPCAVLSIIVAIDTKSTPLFTQVRVGKYGKPFHIIKFRTMVSDAENVEKYFNKEDLAKWKRERKIDNDPRITKLGYFLRKTSIDELPQFFNVLLGQMSVIGPRPITYDELQHFGKDIPNLCSVPCGITGLWQTSRRNEATFASGERQAIELDYLKRASLSLDAQCFFGTFGVMFGKNKTGR